MKIFAQNYINILDPAIQATIWYLHSYTRLDVLL